MYIPTILEIRNTRTWRLLNIPAAKSNLIHSFIHFGHRDYFECETIMTSVVVYEVMQRKGSEGGVGGVCNAV